MELSLLLLYVGVPLTALALLGAILTAVKNGFNEVVTGLQAIHDKIEKQP